MACFDVGVRVDRCTEIECIEKKSQKCKGLICGEIGN